MKKQLICSIILVFLIAGLSGCTAPEQLTGQTPEQIIIGTWNSENIGYMTFYTNHSLKVITQSYSIWGEYEITDDQLFLTYEEQTGVFQYSFTNNNKLVGTNPNGDPAVFTRVDSSDVDDNDNDGAINAYDEFPDDPTKTTQPSQSDEQRFIGTWRCTKFTDGYNNLTFYENHSYYSTLYEYGDIMGPGWGTWNIDLYDGILFIDDENKKFNCHYEFLHQDNSALTLDYCTDSYRTSAYLIKI